MLRRVVARTTVLIYVPYGKPPEKIKPVRVATEKCGMPPLRPPLGARGSAARFPVAEGGVSIRILKSREPLAHSERPSLLYPELGHVTASDTIFLLM